MHWINTHVNTLIQVCDSPGESATAPKLRIIPDGTGVHGLEELIVKNSSDIYSLLDRGSAKRKTAATLLNKGSSRSHSVFCVTVRI